MYIVPYFHHFMGIEANYDEAQDRLERLVMSRVGSRRVQNLRLVIDDDGGITLQGNATTYHAKQFAQHVLMQLTDLFVRANEIEVQ